MISFIFDTETTGLAPRDQYGVYKSYERTELYDSARLVSISWILTRGLVPVIRRTFIVAPDGFVIPDTSIDIHGITNEKANSEGLAIKDVFCELSKDLKKYTPRRIVAHNLDFDLHVILSEMHRLGCSEMIKVFSETPHICTMFLGRNICRIPKENNRFGYKNPKLTELYEYLFGTALEGNHDSGVDAEACFKIYIEMKKLKKKCK